MATKTKTKKFPLGKRKEIASAFAFKASGKKKGPLVIEGFANKAAPDRIKEVIRPKAWKVDNYLKNPTILFNHGHDPQFGSMPIGKAIEVKVLDEGLWIKVQISESDDPKIKALRDLMREGILKTFSVGFDPKKAPTETEKGEFIFEEDGSCELLETSVVTIPMQQDSDFQVKLKSLVAKYEDEKKPDDKKPEKTTTDIQTADKGDDAEESKDGEDIDAAAVLGEALKLYDGLIDGSIEATDESQAQLRDLMQTALDAVAAEASDEEAEVEVDDDDGEEAAATTDEEGDKNAVPESTDEAEEAARAHDAQEGDDAEKDDDSPRDGFDDSEEVSDEDKSGDDEMEVDDDEPAEDKAAVDGGGGGEKAGEGQPAIELAKETNTLLAKLLEGINNLSAKVDGLSKAAPTETDSGDDEEVTVDDDEKDAQGDAAKGLDSTRRYLKTVNEKLTAIGC